MYGVILLAIGLAFSNIFIYAVGIGLFVDEVGYLIIGGKTHKGYYSKTSLFISGSLAILVYFFREQIILLI